MDFETAAAADDVDATALIASTTGFGPAAVEMVETIAGPPVSSGRATKTTREGGGKSTSQSEDDANANANTATSSQFPYKLHKMLDAAATNAFDDVVRWELDGRAFKVYKNQEFVDRVLPIFFKQTRYKSFQRQLNLYGFQRISADGPAKKGYRHPNFIRGRPELCPLISRHTSSGSGSCKDGDTTMATATKSSSATNESTKTTTNSTRSPSNESSKSTVPTKPNPTSGQNAAVGTNNSAVDSSKGTGNFSELHFPFKLHDMLNVAEREGFEDIVSWCPGGNCGFKVHDVDRFTANIMGRFFKQQTKYRSFLRQLNLYGFLRQNTGSNQGGYAHEFFIKGRKDLISRMARVNKSTGLASSVKASSTTATTAPASSAVPVDTSKLNSFNAPMSMAGLALPVQGNLLPTFDAETAVRLLATKYAFQPNGSLSLHTELDMSLQQNCIIAIMMGWNTLRSKLYGSIELRNIMKCIPSHILVDLLINVERFSSPTVPPALPPQPESSTNANNVAAQYNSNQTHTQTGFSSSWTAEV
jgi:hypothetical protein